MDLKQEAARAGASLITNQLCIGLGEGSTIAFLVAELAKKPVIPGRVFYSSSEKTIGLLAKAGFETGDPAQTSEIDIYFDGCDQVDHALNALKSGAGIHTMEKLLACMAREFVLLADESKYLARFDGKHPLVVELIPESLAFIGGKIAAIAPGVRIERRETAGSATITRHGNFLVDCWLPDWSGAEAIGKAIRILPGVLETSLFDGIAKKAVIASATATMIVEPREP